MVVGIVAGVVSVTTEVAFVITFGVVTEIVSDRSDVVLSMMGVAAAVTVVVCVVAVVVGSVDVSKSEIVVELKLSVEISA